MKKGDKVVVLGHYSTLTRDASIEELAAYWGVFYGYQRFTGYPVFDTTERVASGWAYWVHDCVPTLEQVEAPPTL